MGSDTTWKVVTTENSSCKCSGDELGVGRIPKPFRALIINPPLVGAPPTEGIALGDEIGTESPRCP
jgi:hypothetical protein